MELIKEIGEWRSIRRFKDEPVPDMKIKVILEAARRAPSWENYQPWHFIVITDPETKTLLKELSGGQSFAAKAPLVVCACADLRDFSFEKARERLSELLLSVTGKEQSPEFIEEKYISVPLMTPARLGPEIILARALEQLSYAISFMILEAAHQGIGSCVVGAFGSKATKQFPDLQKEFMMKLDLPDEVVPLVLVPMGYPSEEPELRPRKSFETICHKDKFGGKFTS